MGFQLVPISMTLNDLEPPHCST